MKHFNGFSMLNDMIKEDLCRLLPEQGRIENATLGLALTRYDCPTSPARCLHMPMAAYVAQGRKHSFYGEYETSYGVGQCVVLGVDVPGIFQIENASRKEPFLSLSLKIDNRLISRLFGEMPQFAESIPADASHVGVTPVDFNLLDAFRRLVELARNPEKIPVLGSLILSEIHFLLLSGSLGAQLRLFNSTGTKGWQIRNAISWLKENFKSELRMPDLAKKVNMAPSTFNRHFRQATGLSPLQFQKHLRLHEAERLMLVENHDASSAALAVGYCSGSQFTKEYKRLFGSPPRQNISSRHL